MATVQTTECNKCRKPAEYLVTLYSPEVAAGSAEATCKNHMLGALDAYQNAWAKGASINIIRIRDE